MICKWRLFLLTFPSLAKYQGVPLFVFPSLLSDLVIKALLLIGLRGPMRPFEVSSGLVDKMWVTREILGDQGVKSLWSLVKRRSWRRLFCLIGSLMITGG